MEEWRDIPGYVGYQASSEGRIKNSITGYVIKPYLRPDGRKQFHIALGARRRRKKLMVYQAVALAFLGMPPPGKCEVNHKDGKLPTNDRPENLEWTNRSGNVAHAVAMGLNSTRRFAVIGTCVLSGARITFKSQKHAEVALSGKASSAVHHCLIGKKKSAYGYTWCRG